MLKHVLLFSLSLLLSLNDSAAKIAPDYIHPCPELTDKCLQKAITEVLPPFANGIPELGIKSIDPLYEDQVKLELPGGFQVEFNNGTMTGLRNCIIDSVSFKDGEANIKMHCDLTIKGKYKASGRILIVSINGDGDAKIKIKKAIISAQIKFQDKVRDGVTYYEVKSFDFKQSYGDRVTFALTNLFKGNPEISEVVLQFLNQNWRQVAEEFGKPLVNRLVTIVYEIVKKLFLVIPKNELFVEGSI